MRKRLILAITLIMSITSFIGCSEKNTSQEQAKESSKVDVVEILQEESETEAVALTQSDETESDYQEKSFYDIQKIVDSGQQTWRLNPKEVAVKFANQTLNFEGTTALLQSNEMELIKRVTFTKQSGDEIDIILYQPVVKGENGIWEVEFWFDEHRQLHQNKDLTSVSTMFYEAENVPQNVKEYVRDFIVKDWTEAFEPHYDVLGFYANDVSYTVIDNVAELKFIFTLMTKNFYKDPDTVEYIKEAKEKGSEHYQILYNEYNMPKMGNVDLKVTMLLDDFGEVIPDTIQVFNNAFGKYDEYVPAKAADFIIN